MVDYLDLIQNRIKFQKHVFDHLCSNLDDNARNKLLQKDSNTICNVFQHQAWPDKMITQTLILLHHFSYVADLLYDYLKGIHKQYGVNW